MELNSKIPDGSIDQKWTKYKGNVRLVNPSNKRSIEVIVVGTGLAGSSAAASLAEMGYSVKVLCFQDSPRRAHSIAAQGGINAAKNYMNDGDSTYRLFYDTIKGGDYRSREANVHRLAEVSTNIIDQCVAQGVPFARDYGGLLDNRSFGGTQVSRTFYAKGQTGQQLLLGAYSALSRQIGKGTVEMLNRHEMLDVVVVDGKARGIIARNLVTGELERHSAHAVVLCTGGYGNVFFLSTNAMGSNVTAAWRAHKRGATFANPCFTQIHPTCIPVSGEHQSKLTLMSESLRNDGRIWVPKNLDDVKAIKEGRKKPTDLSEDERVPIELVSIDEMFNFDKLDFIKLDVEGYEQNVILGAYNTIRKCKPVIMLENWDDHFGKVSIDSTSAKFSMLLELGYAITQVSDCDFLFVPTTNIQLELL